MTDSKAIFVFFSDVLVLHSALTESSAVNIALKFRHYCLKRNRACRIFFLLETTPKDKILRIFSCFDFFLPSDIER